MLYADANQSFTVGESVSASRWLAEHNVAWLEEYGPCGLPWDMGSRCRRERSTRGDRRECMQMGLRISWIGAAHYLQPDIGRCGGVTEWIKIAQMAEDHDLRLTSHLLHELSVGLIAAFPSGYKVEFMNFSSMPPLPRISRFGTATLWSRKVSAMGLYSQTLPKSFMPLEPALTG